MWRVPSCLHHCLLALLLAAQPAVVRAIQTAPQSMVPLFQVNPTDPADRATQTRRFATADTASVLEACAAVLDDMGYTRTEFSRVAGVVSATREAKVPGAGVAHAAAEAAVIAGSILLSLMLGEDVTTDLPEQVAQIIHVSILVTPDPGNRELSQVRISVDRDLVYDHDRGIVPDHTELPRIYEEFFEELQRATFLEAQRL